MNLEKWSQVAEIVGSVAIVVTLVVLTIEVRDNTRAIDSANFQEISRDVEGLISAIPIEVRDKARSGTPLSNAERLAYFGFLTNALRTYESWWQQWRLGTLPDEVFHSYMTHMTVTFSDEVARDLWSGPRIVSYIPEFEAYVETFLDQNPLDE
jgi:hypothetical protein